MEKIKNKAEKLSENEIEKVAGGYIHYRPDSKSDFKYVLVDDNMGYSKGRYATLEEAKEAAAKLSNNGGFTSEKQITDDQLKFLTHSYEEDNKFYN